MSALPCGHGNGHGCGGGQPCKGNLISIADIQHNTGSAAIMQGHMLPVSSKILFWDHNQELMLSALRRQ